MWKRCNNIYYVFIIMLFCLLFFPKNIQAADLEILNQIPTGVLTIENLFTKEQINQGVADLGSMNIKVTAGNEESWYLYLKILDSSSLLLNAIEVSLTGNSDWKTVEVPNNLIEITNGNIDKEITLYFQLNLCTIKNAGEYIKSSSMLGEHYNYNYDLELRLYEEEIDVSSLG